LHSLVDFTLQHTATHRNTLPHTATHCHTLPHTATHCNSAHPELSMALFGRRSIDSTLQYTATQCNTPQHTATHCNTLQHTAISHTLSLSSHCLVDARSTCANKEIRERVSRYTRKSVKKVICNFVPADPRYQLLHNSAQVDYDRWYLPRLRRCTFAQIVRFHHLTPCCAVPAVCMYMRVYE